MQCVVGKGEKIKLLRIRLCVVGLGHFWVKVQGDKKRMDNPIFKSSDYNFTLITSIWFIMNYFDKEVQYVSEDQLKLKINIKMYFQSDPNCYIFHKKSF